MIFKAWAKPLRFIDIDVFGKPTTSEMALDFLCAAGVSSALWFIGPVLGMMELRVVEGDPGTGLRS